MKTVARATGAISDIVYLGNNLIGSVSIDRFLRVYDIKLNDEVENVYMKNQLKCIAISADEESKEKPTKANEEDDDDAVSDNEDSEGSAELLEEDDDAVDVDWNNIEYNQSFDDDDEEDDGFIEIDTKKKKGSNSKKKKSNKKK